MQGAQEMKIIGPESPKFVTRPRDQLQELKFRGSHRFSWSGELPEGTEVGQNPNFTQLSRASPFSLLVVLVTQRAARFQNPLRR